MSFTNPAGPDAVAGAAGYVQALLEILGDRDPIEVMAELPSWIKERIVALNDRGLRRPEAPGKWSVIEVVQHLADSELINGYRIRSILDEDRPPIRGYDQDSWSRRFGYAQVDRDTALAQLEGIRAANLALYRSLAPRELAREGVHSERGPESVGQLIRLLGAHDLVHRRQIDRILGAA
ncbi:MAG: DinB family protein [Gemmatimonadota bacterium]